MANLDPKHFYLAACLLSACAGAFFDFRSRRIPNLLTGPAILIALVAHLVFNGLPGLVSSAEAGLICGLIFFLLFLAGGMGAGDVKLVTAVACFAGLPEIASLLILTVLSGGVMAASVAMKSGRMRETLGNIGTLVMHHGKHGFAPHPDLNIRNSKALRMPYGLAIAAGAVLTILIKVGTSR